MFELDGLSEKNYWTRTRTCRTRAVQLEEMYLPETGWKLAYYIAICENTGVIPSPFEEAISETS